MGRRCKHTTFLEHPKSRSECRNGPRPCPWVSCRYHAYLEVNRTTGTVKFNFPDKEPWELEETCILDLAERGAMTFEEIGRRLNVTRERSRQIAAAALAQVHEAIHGSTDVVEEDARPEA